MEFHKLSRSGRTIQIRAPSLEDAPLMCDYINTLSQERTFIRFQGETMSLEEETAFLNHILAEIQAKRSIMLLAFSEGALVGVSGIDMADKTERHIGHFGISIKREFREDGIGTLLLQCTLEEAVKSFSQLEIVTLFVFSTNKIGIELYKKQGFIQYGSLPKGTKLEGGYADHIMMYKKIER